MSEPMMYFTLGALVLLFIWCVFFVGILRHLDKIKREIDKLNGSPNE